MAAMAAERETLMLDLSPLREGAAALDRHSAATQHQAVAIDHLASAIYWSGPPAMLIVGLIFGYVAGWLRGRAA